MSKRRINIVTAVNSANVSKSGNIYTIRDVVHAIDGIVLNRRLYPGKELEKAAKGLEGKPAPAGHPKDRKGRHISATNGEALAAAWIGAYCQNSRYEGGRAMVDIVLNGNQAQAMPEGRAVVERLDAAIAGTNTDPIGVSSGLFLEEVNAQGKSLGKDYDSIATNMRFDHVAILLNERPAGTPEEGVGMFLNAQGEEEPVEVVTINAEPADRRDEGLLAGLRATVRRLLGNGTSDVSFDQISQGLYALLPEGGWLQEVFQRYTVWRDRDGKLFKQDYALSSDGSVAWISNPVEVERRVDYVTVTNHKDDQVKETIIAALNAAGISGVAAMTDAQLLASYEALKAQPHVNALNEANEKLTAANSKLAEITANQRAAEEVELTTLATNLASDVLSVDDLKKLGLPRLKEIQANAEAAGKKAAPVTPAGGGAGKKDEFDGYSLNSHFEETK
ncbi:hypothetical protein [Roseateles sp.]|uniref:hypothetical protein n=1 Tax=Roseateles sp. TaxID=1971397 RepID=UPI0031DABA44